MLDSEDQFYEIFLEKWHEYLYRLRSGEKLRTVVGHDFETPDDVKGHMEEIRIHLRGHNLYDIYYGRYKDRERRSWGAISMKRRGKISRISWILLTVLSILRAERNEWRHW